MDEKKLQTKQKKKANVGIWTLLVSIVLAFGFGYGVGFVSSAYFKNININKELSPNIQILQANATSNTTNLSKPKPQVVNKSKISIQSNSTNSTLNIIVKSLTNETNATKTTQLEKSQKNQTTNPNTQEAKTKSMTTAINKETTALSSVKSYKYIVQVASFPDKSKALNLVIFLIKKGFNALSEQITINNTPYTRVVIQAHTLAEANSISSKLKQEGITNLPIIYERKLP